MNKLQKHLAWAALLFLVSVLAEWRAIFATIALAWRSDEYTYILLVLPIAAALVLWERQSLRATMMVDLRVGPCLLGTAIVIACFAQAQPTALPDDIRLSISIFALVLSWIGMVLLCFGQHSARSILFPLLLLFGFVPLPHQVLNPIIALLQQSSAWSAHALFAAVGIPVAQNGVVLTIPNLTIRVAPECSSIRSSSMLLVTTLIMAQLLLRGTWRRILLVCFAIPFSVAKNGLRIFVIAVLGTRVDPGYLNGRLHHQGGIVFFLIALMGTFALLWLMQKSENSLTRKISDPGRQMQAHLPHDE